MSDPFGYGGTQLQVQFDFVQFQAQFPEFAYLTQLQATGYWDTAMLFLRNDGGGPYRDALTQQTLLNMLTAHIAQLMAPSSSGVAASPIVGRIASFSEGSVSGSTDMPNSLSAAWFNQTKYGAMFWEATSSARTAFYTPGRQRFRSGFGPRFPRVW